MRRLIALIATIGLVCTLTSCSFSGSGSRTVVADLQSASGLFVGNDVGILGVSVGKVTKLEPRGETVRVTMEVNEDQALPEGVGAVIVSRSAATDRYVELTPAYTSGPKASGDVKIPLAQTRVPVEFDEVLGSLGDFADGISGQGKTENAVKKLLDSQSKLLGGNGKLINSTVQSLAAAVNGVSAQRGDAADTLAALDTLTKGLATNEATVRAFIQQVSEASSMLAEERQNFKTSLVQTTKMIRVVADFVKQNRAELRRAVRQTNGVMTTVLDEKDRVTQILRTLPLAAQNLLRLVTKDNRVRVRLDVLALTPVADYLEPVCEALPADLCTAIGLDPKEWIDAIDRLLGGLAGGKP